MDTDQHDPQSHSQRDDPIRNLVPRFTPPSPQETEEPPADLTTAEQSPNRPHLPLLPGPEPGMGTGRGERPANRGSDRTATSTTGDRPVKVGVDEATGLVIGLVAVVATAAAVLVRWRLKAKLREPTAGQRRAIAAPLARILLRRTDMSLLAPDLGDALTAAAATGAYIGAGPLLGPLNDIRDDGMPADLNQPEDL